MYCSKPITIYQTLYIQNYLNLIKLLNLIDFLCVFCGIFMSLIIKTQANGIYQHETKALTKIREAFSVEDEMR